VTGITKDQGQSTLANEVDAPRETATPIADNTAADVWNDELPFLTRLVRDFAMARAWSKFHTPRSLILALLGELGELAELVQWTGDSPEIATENPVPTTSGLYHASAGVGELHMTAPQRDKLRQELADVAIYLLRLADVCNVHWDQVRAAMEAAAK
jgi:dCTP diphosphatase